MPVTAAEPAAPLNLDRAQVRRAFERAAATYDGAAVLQREVGQRMAERLGFVRMQPGTILDAGCGTGASSARLRPNAIFAHGASAATSCRCPSKRRASI